MDTLHGEAVTDANELETKDVQSNSTNDPNEIQPNLEEVVVTQPISVGVVTNEQMDITNQQNLVGMFVKYGASGLVGETKMDLTQLGDVEFIWFSFYTWIL